MNIIIFGATGTIGSHLVRQSLAHGYQVTAFARQPSMLKLDHQNLTFQAGDALDLGAVTIAVESHDAVIIALGAGMKGEVRAQGTTHIVQAMQRHAVRRLICLSSLGVGDSRGNLNFFWKYIMFGMFLRLAYADHVLQEQAVKDSGLEWTIVRPGAYVDGGVTENCQHGFSSAIKGLELRVSRADVANFMLQQLTHDTYLCQSPGLSY